jgi:2-polyprenyl-6-methoxyphenol hydroxylase-like FAD-dependent oxidoreductase
VTGAGTPPVRSTTFHLADAVTTISVKPKHGVQALYAPRRRVLDAILADAARNAGADVRFGASVSDLRRDRAGRVTGITGRVGGARLEASADLVIGADGRRSTCRVVRRRPARPRRAGLERPYLPIRPRRRAR